MNGFATIWAVLEVGRHVDVIAVRDTKDRDRGTLVTLVYTAEAWAAFTASPE